MAITLDGTDGITYGDGTTASTAYRTLISEATASNSSTIEFTSGFSSSYSYYTVEIDGMIPVTDGANLYLRMSTDGGTSFIATGYRWTDSYLNTTSSGWTSFNGNGVAQVQLTRQIGNASTDAPVGANLHLFNLDASSESILMWETNYGNTSGVLRRHVGGGGYDSNVIVNGLQFILSTGNISTGTFKFYGVY